MKRAELEYQLLEDMLGDLFPDSKVRLLVMADKLIVKGQAKDSEEASQIMTVVRNQAGSRVYNRSNAAGMGLAGGYAANVIDDEASGRNRQRQRMQVINMLRVPGVQQVALKVKIAELNRTAVRGFGLDVDGTVNFSNNPEGSAMFLQSMINVATGDTPALLTQFDGDDIRFGIRWLQQRGVLRLLSEPTLVTMSGRPATFVAGGEFAVPTVVGSVGLNAVTTDFRAFGVIISFMPIVLDKDRIRLEVAPEFSQINNQLDVGQTPGLNVRAVTTTVEMREGQTLAIAGLLEDTMAGNTTGNIPLLSQIFGRRDITRSETELIILVTPELVQAMEPEEVPPLPGFDVTEPNGKEFFLEGKLEGNPTREFRSTVWPRLKKRYGSGGPSMISGPFGHGQ
jgi:pilus assembly protein CpaC